MNKQLTYDWIVIGSGGGGLTSAIRAHDLGASVLIVEKSEYVGGSTALSGGTIWVPNNHHMSKAGVDDSDEEAMNYLKEITKERTAETKLLSYVTHAKRMVEYLENRTKVKFSPLKLYTDYYPESEGSKSGARSIEAKPYSAIHLRKSFQLLKPPHPQTTIFGSITMTGSEARKMMQTTLVSRIITTWHIMKYYLKFWNFLIFHRNPRLTLGNALVGRLYKSTRDRKIPIWTQSAVKNLIISESGDVNGVSVEKDGEIIKVHAKKGVLLAAGGFPHNESMRKKYQQPPIGIEWTAANKENTGDLVKQLIEIDAKMDLLDDAWWTPTFIIPGIDKPYVVVIEKSLPGSIIVNSSGKRFVNEAAPYIDVVKAMYASPENYPAYLIVDARFRKKYPIGPILPGQFVPDSLLPKNLKTWLVKDDSILGLAVKMGIDPERLELTVSKMNFYAMAGKDKEFGKGSNSYDKYYSDPQVKPNPNLAPISKPPYYCVPIYPGDLGTKGGVVTDEYGRVLLQDGSIIHNLYATGNITASIMGNSYAGAGATIGPAMTFGFLAAEHAFEFEREPDGIVDK